MTLTLALTLTPTPRPEVCYPLTPEREEYLRGVVVTEAISWEKTPYVAQGDVKGGCVDCCMLLVRVWVDTGIVTPFDPRPYEPQWFMHHEEEHYLNWVTKVAVEIPEADARAGDVVLWMFGRAYSHAGIMVSSKAITHASGIHRKCTRSDLNTAWLLNNARAETPEDARLAYIGKGREKSKLRPRKFFNVFEGIRQWQG